MDETVKPKLSDLIEQAVPLMQQYDIEIIRDAYVSVKVSEGEPKLCGVCLLTAAVFMRVGDDEIIEANNEARMAGLLDRTLPEGLVEINHPTFQGERRLASSCVIHMFDTLGWSPKKVITYLRKQGA